MYLRYIIVSLFLLVLIDGCKKDEINNGNVQPKGVKRIWALNDGEKIKYEDTDNQLATDPNNAVWKDSTINIFGGRNEIVAFQLIIQSERGGAENVNVAISDLKNGTEIIPGSKSGSSDPYDYRDRYIELFTEHYLNIATRSLRYGSLPRVQHLRLITPDGFRIVLYDYEYLWLATQAGMENEIKPVIDQCVPTGLWDAKYQSNISWSSRGYSFEQYRKQLAILLSTAGKR